jgi:hypothetical protein
MERLWLDTKDPREKWATIIPLIGIFIDVIISAVLTWDGMRSVINHTYYKVLISLGDSMRIYGLRRSR